jgi:hypothetical protein
MGFSRSRVSHEENALVSLQILTSHEFQDQRTIDGGLLLELKSIQGFHDGKLGGLDPALSGTLFSLDQFPFAKAQQVSDVILAFPGTDAGHRMVFAQHGGQLELLQIMVE